MLSYTSHSSSPSGFEVLSAKWIPSQVLSIFALGFAACLFLWSSSALSSVTFRSYDNARTGWNQNETTLTPANVNPNTFHKIGELRVDDKIETSPLFVSGVNTVSGTRDLVIVATTNNTVFAFDANSNQLVWAKYLGTPVEKLKPAVYNKWGITSTPVVDTDTGTIYVVRLGWEGLIKCSGCSGYACSTATKTSVPRLSTGFRSK